MKQSNSPHNSMIRPASVQQLHEQQEQIDSLASSLENISDFLEYQKKQGSADVSNLSVAIQESIKYLSVIVNNLDVLRQEIELVKSEVAYTKDITDKNNRNQLDELDSTAVTIESIRKEQIQSQNSLLAIKKVLVEHQRPQNNQFDWRFLLSIMFGASLVAVLASSLSVGMMASKFNEINNTMIGKMKGIQEHLGINSGGTSRSRRN